MNTLDSFDAPVEDYYADGYTLAECAAHYTDLDYPAMPEPEFVPVPTAELEEPETPTYVAETPEEDFAYLEELYVHIDDILMDEINPDEDVPDEPEVTFLPLEERFPTHPTPTQISQIYQDKWAALRLLTDTQLGVADLEAAVASAREEYALAEKQLADQINYQCQQAILNKDDHDLSAPSNKGRNETERDAINHELFAEDYARLAVMKQEHKTVLDSLELRLHELRNVLTQRTSELKLVEIQIASLEMLAKWGYAQ